MPEDDGGGLPVGLGCPTPLGPYNLAQYEASQFQLPAFPTTNQQLPKQEPGSRPRVK